MPSHRLQSYHVINSAVKALTFYARKQHLVRTIRHKRDGEGPAPAPLFAPRVDEIVHSVLRQTSKATAHRHIEGNVDIQANVRASTMTRADVIRAGFCMMTLIWAMGGRATEMATSMAVTVGHLLCTQTFCRNNEARAICLKHISIITVAGAGPDVMRVIRIITNLSKCNQNGHLEESAVIPHKDAALCSIGFMALSLMLRWLVLLEHVPDFSCRAGWYSVHLMPGAKSLQARSKIPEGGFPSKEAETTYSKVQREADAPVTYQKCESFLTKVFGFLGMAVAKKGHLGRVLGAILADMESMGRERGAIADLAHWMKDQCRKSYLLAVPVAGLLLGAQYMATDAMNYVNLRLRLSLADKPTLQNVFAKKLFPAQEDDDVSEVSHTLKHLF
jgi:hypothetical protein